jgi:hypothetical protein
VTHPAAATAPRPRTRASSRPLAAPPRLFPFVQLDLPGTVGLDEGRYLGREPERVLVVRIANPQPPPRRRLGRTKPKDADPSSAPVAVPVTTLTVVTPEPLGDAGAAAAWLARVRADDDAIEAAIVGALELVNRAVHAHRTAIGDPGVGDVVAEAALAVRIGFGDGDELADGRYAEAIDVPASGRRRRRVEALRPTERVAGVLAGREIVAACELLLLRARADLDAGRRREAAMQLRSGMEAMLADRAGFTASGQEADLAAVEAARPAVENAAETALKSDLGPAEAEAVAEALRVAERVLRRERASR